jgi:hypothetical protein
MCKGAVHVEESRVMKSWRRPYTEGVLTEEELQQYWEEGFVVKEGLLPKEQLENVKNAIKRCAYFIVFLALLIQQSGLLTLHNASLFPHVLYIRWPACSSEPFLC